MAKLSQDANLQMHLVQPAKLATHAQAADQLAKYPIGTFKSFAALSSMDADSRPVSA